MVSVATFTAPLSSAASQASQFAAAQWNRVPTMPSLVEAKSAISSVPLSTYGIGAGVIAGATALGFGAKYAYARYSAATASASGDETLKSDSAKAAESVTLFRVPGFVSSGYNSSVGLFNTLRRKVTGAESDGASKTYKVGEEEVVVDIEPPSQITADELLQGPTPSVQVSPATANSRATEMSGGNGAMPARPVAIEVY